MPIPEKSLKEMYPGRFLEAANLSGKTVTVTIEKITGDLLETERGKKRGYILTFVGKKKGLLLNKTNSLFIAAMFGENPNGWEGKRIAIYPTRCRLGGETVDCIRVFGSPDLTEDKPFHARIGFKKVKATLHAVKAGEKLEHAPEMTEHEFVPDAKVLEAWSALGWTREEGMKDADSFEGDGGYVEYLGGLIDQANSQEAF
jgi:hypothetical protein